VAGRSLAECVMEAAPASRSHPAIPAFSLPRQPHHPIEATRLKENFAGRAFASLTASCAGDRSVAHARVVLGQQVSGEVAA
jgi:hypothetical protein